MEPKDNSFLCKKTLNCAGTLVNLSSPAIMGILNVTPDSFYDGGKYDHSTAALRKAEAMLHAGAHFIDVGGCSTRPGAQSIELKEEIDRTLPVIKAILKEFPNTIISIDSHNAEVIKAALDAGALMVNDVMGGNEKKFTLAAQFGVPYIIMHNRGTPATMQQLTDYQNICAEIASYMVHQAKEAERMGVKDIIIDPGFGFAKTLAQNYEILKNLLIFSSFGYPVLCGISRKSMIYKALNTTPEDALIGTCVLNTLALERGAKILRVHDVKEAAATVQLFTKMQSA